MVPRFFPGSSMNMKHIMKLENVMLTDYEETKTNGTQTTLIAIGVTSTLFKLKPSTIKELYKSCKLNSVDFLREIYRILTGNDFCEEGYKKVYDCNERIILSAIAFLTLPETIKELHKRLPTVIMPKLPLKPKLITCLARRKDSCPYKEELFKRPDWTGYRNALQKWQKHCKLTAIPKIILPLNKYDPFFMNNRSEFKKQRKNISTEHLEEISTKELQTISPTMYEKDIDSSRERPLESTNFNILQPPDDSKKSSFRILSKKPETAEYKIYGPPKPSGAGKKSWLGKKDAHYIIAGISTKDSHSYPVTYENAGVANVTPSNSDEKFFAVLKFGDQTKKIFPSGRENLSIKWQEWLQNANESYKQLEEETDELIKNVQATIKSAFPGPFCDSCCSCRQTRKFEEQLQQSKINKALIDGEKNLYITNSMAMQSSGPNPTDVSINLVVEDEIRTNILHPIKNVPPCSCPIQQMVDKDVSLCISKEIIPWTKEGLCPGKKYRPKEPGAYSCKMYPGDEFCKYNPFTKEIMKMERRKIQKEKEKEGEEERVKEKTKLIEAVKKEIQVPETDIIEKKIDKFIPDPDYPAYDNPWNISRTAPPAKIIKTDYEATLKLTSPEWPTTSYLPLKMQENQNNIFSKELSHTSVKKETSKVIMGLQSFNKMTSSKIGHRRDVSHKETTDKIISKNKYSEEIIDEIDYQQNESHKQIKKTKENIDDKSHRINGDKKYVNKFNQLIAIIKI
ncbi:hypothetical protein ALC62_02374 [Cyphomyrmex costatus]|uniref:DUF4770 domain-containing protein n=1 Tax=Cyphomyrmex costatus TaxID=456900 RepID=A0A195D1C6_9HYME|nr:hypothetical protein ALC62_02374 [Cyphomyrmex costatus]